MLRMFDASKTFLASIEWSADQKTCVPVRFPTDEEWVRWRLDRIWVKAEQPDGSVDLEEACIHPADLLLARNIQLDFTRLTVATATQIVYGLIACYFPRCPIRLGNAYQIELVAVGDVPTLHVLRNPSLREIDEYESRLVPSVKEESGGVTRTVDFRPGMELYDRLVFKSDGYASSVPGVHKAEVVTELIRNLRNTGFA
jgi:hypothetical protein